MPSWLLCRVQLHNLPMRTYLCQRACSQLCEEVKALLLNPGNAVQHAMQKVCVVSRPRLQPGLQFRVIYRKSLPSPQQWVVIKVGTDIWVYAGSQLH